MSAELPEHGFLFSNGSFSTLAVPGSNVTSPLAINNAGQVVGAYFDAAGTHGFLFSEGRYTTLDVPGSTSTMTYDINDVGQVVGRYHDATRWHGFLATPGPTSFATFTAKLDIALAPRIDDAFDLTSTFTLGDASDGIDPRTEEMELELTGGTGSFTTSIPAGSFTQDQQGRFKFAGTIDGVALEAMMTLLGDKQYEFKVEGQHADLSGIANPVTVMLAIGNDSGSTVVTAILRGRDQSIAAR